jgi:hypothetical protein
MNLSQPYLFVEIWVPKRAPYNHPEHGWPTIVGDFVKPLADAHPDMRIWFLREGPWWQLCFAASDLHAANKTMRDIARRRGFTIKRYIRGSNLGEALAGSRWLPRRKQKTCAEKRRSYLLTDACHAVCAVYMDSLVRRGRHWVVERPQCNRQNPHGNLFESFMHLVANLSDAQFDVQFKVRTRWMHDDWKELKATCHL